MENNTHKAVWEWLLSCPHIRNLFFSFARPKNGDTVFQPMTAYNDTLIREFIGSDTERRYDFALIRFDVISDEPNSTDNIDALIDVEQIAAWIDEQDAVGNYPVLPAGCTPIKVAAYPPGAGYFAAQNEDQAKYLFQFYLDYLKEE